MKTFNILFIATLFIGIISCSILVNNSSSPAEKVFPHLDANNSRWFFFNSASRPFGMVNLSPDTELDGVWGSGYKYDEDTIKGFSHIHGWQISGVSVMPVILEDSTNDYFTNYYSNFSHDDEVVEVGYHKLELNRYEIEAELTSTCRVGFHQYHYPESQNAAVVFKLEGMLGPCEIKNGSLKMIDSVTISGQMVDAPTMRRPKDFNVFFVAKFNSDIKEIQKSDHSKNMIIDFGDLLGEPLKMKVAISYTSITNAEINLETELKHWDFDKVVSESKVEWNSMLGRIEIEGGSDEIQKRFYTDLWHALQGRRIISDINGAYPDNTGDSLRIGQLPLDENGKPKFNHFNSDSFWGAQWTLNTLWGLAYPDIYEEFINSLLTYYEDGGLIPRGPSGGNYTHVMTGASSTPFIVSAYQKGLINHSKEYIYEALKKNHMTGGMMGHAGYEHSSAKGGGIEFYIKEGYVPYPLPEAEIGLHRDGAGMTLEYSYQDWTLAQLAKELGKKDDYDYLINRSENYKNLYDSEKEWFRPKDVNGNWRDQYDPYEYRNGFVEGNGAQFTWFVPHNLSGLSELLGGNEKMAEKLHQQFLEAEKLGFTSGTSHAAELHPEFRRIPINYGNQPSIQTAFIFNHIGRSDLTQYWSRKVSQKVHSKLSSEFGYNGDEDQGIMGALAVLMKIGLFQMNGGTEANPVYEIGSPSFDKVTIKLHPEYYEGESFIIRTINNSSDNVYIKSSTFNQKNLTGFKIHHDEIVNGGKLVLEMGAKAEATPILFTYNQ